MENIPRSKVKFAFRRGFGEFHRKGCGSPGLHVFAGVVLLGSEGIYTFLTRLVAFWFQVTSFTSV